MANTVSITVDADTSTAESNVKGMGGKMTTALKGVAAAAGGITLAAAAATALGEEYQTATNTIAPGTGATGKDLEGLTASFKSVWANVPQDAAEVSSAVADINTEFGFTDDKLEDVTEAMLTASRAMGEDLGGVIKSTADLLVAFGEDKGGAEALLDKLTVAAQFSGSSMQALADKVSNFAPQLQALGLPMDEAIALIANMDAAGMSASKMMPGLNTAIKKLSSEGVTDIAGGLQEAIASIQNAGTDAEGLGIAMDLFGAGAGLRFQAAIQEGVFELDTLIATMDGSEGTLKTLGEKTLTTSQKFDIMKNKVKSALSPIGEFATALGPIVIMIPALTTALSALAAMQAVQTAAAWLQTAAMTALNLAFGPIGIAILAIAAAIGVGILIWKNWDVIVEKFREGLEKIKPVFEVVKEFLTGALDSLKLKWDLIWNGMGDTVKLVWDGIKGYVNLWIEALNFLIRGANMINIKVPSWVPKFGGKGFSFNIPEIPKLASGGIVTSPTVAMIGERGPEAVIPLSKGGVGGITINILGPTYGFDDFERRVGEAIVDGVRRGGFSGILATA